MRRLAFVAVLALAACSSSATKPPPAPGSGDDGPGRAHAFAIGALEAVALDDGELVFPNDGKVLAVGHVDEAGDVLAAAGLPRDPLRLSIQPLLVKASGRVLLFDTGTGGSIPNTGWVRTSLTRAGVTPADVTDIFISHGHSAHMGGLVTADGALVYPNATIHLSAPEWAAVQAAPEDKALVDAIAAKVAAFEPGAELLPEVRAVATQGHTPGHSSYAIGTGDERLFYLGDLAHHHVVSVQRPAWPIEFDLDRAAAEAMRQQTLSTLAADHTRVYAVHFPFPGVGHIADRDGTLVWQAE